MGEYNKQTATDLLVELHERLTRIPEQIENASDDGPVIDIIAEALGAAISALKNGPQRD